MQRTRSAPFIRSYRLLLLSEPATLRLSASFLVTDSTSDLSGSTGAGHWRSPVLINRPRSHDVCHRDCVLPIKIYRQQSGRRGSTVLVLFTFFIDQLSLLLRSLLEEPENRTLENNCGRRGSQSEQMSPPRASREDTRGLACTTK